MSSPSFDPNTWYSIQSNIIPNGLIYGANSFRGTNGSAIYGGIGLTNGTDPSPDVDPGLHFQIYPVANLSSGVFVIRCQNTGQSAYVGVEGPNQGAPVLRKIEFVVDTSDTSIFWNIVPWEQNASSFYLTSIANGSDSRLTMHPRNVSHAGQMFLEYDQDPTDQHRFSFQTWDGSIDDVLFSDLRLPSTLYDSAAATIASAQGSAFTQDPVMAPPALTSGSVSASTPNAPTSTSSTSTEYLSETAPATTDGPSPPTATPAPASASTASTSRTGVIIEALLIVAILIAVIAGAIFGYIHYKRHRRRRIEKSQTDSRITSWPSDSQSPKELDFNSWRRTELDQDDYRPELEANSVTQELASHADAHELPVTVLKHESILVGMRLPA